MKKFVTFLICLVIIGVGLAIYFVKDKDEKKEEKELTTIKLAEVTHSVFYAPLYVAIENGYFEDEGIDLDVILTPGADKVSAAVLSNTGGEDDYLVTFAGLTKRDGQFILSRDCDKEFKLEDLYGKEILVGREGGMPALNFLNAMDNSNIDTSKININYAVDFAALSGTFIGGVGEYVNLFEPTATSVVETGVGCIVESIGKLSGEVPYTAFYARKSYLNDNKDLLERFTKAINKGLKYVKENDSSKVAKVILPQFPDTSLKNIEAIIDNYKKYDSWLDSPFITEKSFNNLQDLLLKNNLIKEKVPYKDLINNLNE